MIQSLSIAFNCHRLHFKAQWLKLCFLWLYVQVAVFYIYETVGVGSIKVMPVAEFFFNIAAPIVGGWGISYSSHRVDVVHHHARFPIEDFLLVFMGVDSLILWAVLALFMVRELFPMVSCSDGNRSILSLILAQFASGDLGDFLWWRRVVAVVLLVKFQISAGILGVPWCAQDELGSSVG